MKSNAVGALFYALETKRFLFLLRSGAKFTDTWGLVGGKIEYNESLLQGLHREILEEISFIPRIEKYIPIEKFTSNDSAFQYHTYICVVNSEFIPILNHEHQGYSWTKLNTCPRPLHPGLYNSLAIKVVQQKIKSIEQLY